MVLFVASLWRRLSRHFAPAGISLWRLLSVGTAALVLMAYYFGVTRAFNAHEFSVAR